MTKRFDIEDLERFIMNTIDHAFSSSPNQEGAKALIASRFEIYRGFQRVI